MTALRSVVIIVLSAGASLGVAIDATAAPSAVSAAPASPDDARPSAIYVVLGLATPAGVAGLEGTHRFGPHFELSLGVGEGFAALNGGRNALEAVQLSLMPRLRVPGQQAAFTVGLGVSGGRFGLPHECSSACTIYRTDYHAWMNLEAGIEGTGAFAWRLFGGFGVPDHFHGNSPAGIPYLPYLGFALGHGFGATPEETPRPAP